jgi:ABC-type multidrug transport system permease subunit
MRSSLWQLTLTRLREFVREPEAVFWTFVFPIVLALLLGFAFSSRGDQDVHVGVRDGAGAAAVVAALEDVAGVRVRLLDEEESAAALRRGRVALVVVPGAAGVTYRQDPTAPGAREARLVVDDALQRGAGRRDPVRASLERVEERGSRYIDFLIPGLIGLNLLSTGLWGVGYTVVRMRAGHLLKRYMATPMRRWEFMASFLLGRLVFLAVEIAAILLFARLVFGVEVRGSLALVAAFGVLGAIVFTSFGLLVASRARTTEGIAGIMNLVAVPMWILSGVFFSYERFPEWTHGAIRALPLTPLVDGLRAVINEGATALDTAPAIAVLGAWGLVAFGSSMLLFRWR